jgi:hypothetical protein
MHRWTAEPVWVFVEIVMVNGDVVLIDLLVVIVLISLQRQTVRHERARVIMCFCPREIAASDRQRKSVAVG